MRPFWYRMGSGVKSNACLLSRSGAGKGLRDHRDDCVLDGLRRNAGNAASIGLAPLSSTQET